MILVFKIFADIWRFWKDRAQLMTKAATALHSDTATIIIKVLVLTTVSSIEWTTTTSILRLLRPIWQVLLRAYSVLRLALIMFYYKYVSITLIAFLMSPKNSIGLWIDLF